MSEYSKPIYNMIGWMITSLSFILNLTVANEIMVTVISILSILFLGLKFYEKRLSIKKLRKELKKLEEDVSHQEHKEGK